jgi:outer membrane lipoprotein carrier protein
MEDRMSRFLISVAVAAVALFVTATSCLAASLEEVVAALQAPFQMDTAHDRRIRDYSAEFSQQSSITSLNRTLQAHGKVVVQFGEKLQDEMPQVKFRWEYLLPTAQEIVSNGERVWVYLPENNQVIVTEADQAVAAGENNPMTFLTGLGNLSRDFQIAWADPQRDPAGNYILDLQPRRAMALLTRLVIIVEQAAVQAHLAGRADASGPGAFPIRSTTVFDTNGNSSLIAFHGVQVNTGPSADLFNFTVPAGVDVVRPDEAGLGY